MSAAASSSPLSRYLEALLPSHLGLNASTLLPTIAGLLSTTQEYVGLDDAQRKEAILAALKTRAKNLPSPENLYVPLMIDVVGPPAIDSLLAAVAEAEADPQATLAAIMNPGADIHAVLAALHAHITIANHRHFPWTRICNF